MVEPSPAERAAALESCVERLGDMSPADERWPATMAEAADLLGALGHAAEAERLAASGAQALEGDAGRAGARDALLAARLRHARDAALPVHDAHALVRFESALDDAAAAPAAAAPLAAVLALYGLPDDGEDTARAALDHAALLIRLDRLEEAAPLLDTLWEIVDPGTVLFARVTAQRIAAFLVLEREADAGHAYAQAAARVAAEHGWGAKLAEHLAIIHDELSLVGGEHDALELLEQLRLAAERAGDPEAGALVSGLLAERAPRPVD